MNSYYIIYPFTTSTLVCEQLCSTGTQLVCVLRFAEVAIREKRDMLRELVGLPKRSTRAQDDPLTCHLRQLNLVDPAMINIIHVNPC